MNLENRPKRLSLDVRLIPNTWVGQPQFGVSEYCPQTDVERNHDLFWTWNSNITPVPSASRFELSIAVCCAPFGLCFL